jgi:transglutaminase-like putative cysteine protease
MPPLPLMTRSAGNSSTRSLRSLHAAAGLSPLARLRQRLVNLPAPEPEDSLPLRVLVQLLVAVGIIATDVAATDSVSFMGISLWAVPLSFAGATWSWFRRRQRNIPVKFLIAIGMLLALALFFTRLWTERNDTRIALSTLLIHLQILHSFDLPRRKDLGYSAVIGLILLGVAATLSQTLAFAPLLLLFLAIALPILVLDYRSRLGLVSPSFQGVRFDLAPKRLGALLLLVLGLGLGIFLLLPRMPGYQLRSFPVSSPIQTSEQFDSSNIVNPGYGRGDRATGVGKGQVERGSGAVDDEYYYGFNSTVNQNLRGTMQPKVVMRVRSQAPGFWRVLAFDRYTGQGWQISRNDPSQVQTLQRSAWSFRFTLPWSVTLNKTREVIQSFTLVANLPNLIPALFEAKEVYFPTDRVAIDLEGGLRSPVGLSEGLTYTVVSEVPYRDRSVLRTSSIEYPPFIKDHYLQVPEAIADRIRKQTEALLALAPKPVTTPSEKALYLAQALKQRYQIRSDLPFFADDEDLVEAFLFKYEGGYPDHFATALTVMLRSIGIPARLVMGFAPGAFNPFTGYYVVKNTDAYAMTEVYFHKYGWFAFDPIPGHEIVPPSIEESQTFGVIKQFWSWVAGWLPSPLTGFFNRIFELIGAAISWLISQFTQGWLGILTGLGALTAVGFVGWLGWSGWQSWRDRRWLAKLPLMESVYQQMLRWLAEQGDRKPAHLTPLEYARDCRSQHSPEIADAIDRISAAYVGWRYGGEFVERDRIRQDLRQLQRSRRGRSARRR